MKQEESVLRPARRRFFVCLTTAFLVLAFAASSFAHAVVLWCYVENHHVYVEAFFMGGNKVQNGKILVYDKNGKKVLEGTTNKEGLFDFDPPFEDDMTIVLKIDSGHGSDFALTRQDFIDAAKEAAEKK
jgi:nickel transport protein